MTRYFNTEGTRDAVEQSAFEKIYEVVRQIPYGQVATYGQVAALAGNNRWARVVGYALHANPDPDHIPCYRVSTRRAGCPMRLHLAEATARWSFYRQRVWHLWTAMWIWSVISGSAPHINSLRSRLL